MSKSIDEMAEDKISEAKAEVIAAISETMDLYGVTLSVGRLYATLYLNDQMTLNEMRDELNMSKSCMSTGIRKLQKYGMVKRKYEKGSREDTYKTEKNVFRSLMTFNYETSDREATKNVNSIEDEEKDLIEVINDESVSEELREEARKNYNLMDNSKEYYHWLNRLADSVKTGEIFSYLPK